MLHIRNELLTSKSCLRIFISQSYTSSSRTHTFWWSSLSNCSSSAKWEWDEKDKKNSRFKLIWIAKPKLNKALDSTIPSVFITNGQGSFRGNCCCISYIIDHGEVASSLLWHSSMSDISQKTPIKLSVTQFTKLARASWKAEKVETKYTGCFFMSWDLIDIWCLPSICINN